MGVDVVECEAKNMKAFIICGLLCLVSADQSHHQVFKQGNAPAVSVSIHKPHGAIHASVASQPHAAPQSVHGYGGYEKPIAKVIAPAALPHHTPYAPAPYHPAPAPYHPAPVVHAPVVHAPAPYHAPVPATYHPAPAPYKPAPYHAPAPVYHKPAPIYHKPAPVYHKPAPPPPAYKPAPVVVHKPAYKPAPAPYHPAH